MYFPAGYESSEYYNFKFNENDTEASLIEPFRDPPVVLRVISDQERKDKPSKQLGNAIECLNRY